MIIYHGIVDFFCIFIHIYQDKERYQGESGA